MGVIMPYGVAIREAIASNDLSQMKAVKEQSGEFVKEQGDIEAALIELHEAIQKLESK